MNPAGTSESSPPPVSRLNGGEHRLCDNSSVRVARMAGLFAAALGTPGLRRLAAGRALSALGTWTFMVTLSVYAYGRGGASAVGLAAFTRMVPAGLAAPFTGLLADMYSRRDVLVALCAARAATLAAIAALAASAPLGIILLLAALFTALDTGHRPAQTALAPELASSPRQLAAAGAVWNGLENGGFLLGSILGGALVAATTATTGFVVTAAAFAAAGMALLLITRDPVPEHREAPSGSGVAREAVAGFPEVACDPALRLTVGTLSLASLAEGATDVLVVVSALELLHMGAAGVGWLNAAWGMGGLAGGAVALGLLGRGRLATGLALGAGLAGGALVLIAALPHVASALFLLAVLGVGYALIEVAGHSLVQRQASDHVLARAMGVVETSYNITTGVGSLLAPLLISALGVRGALLAVGAVLPAFALARRRALGRLEAGALVPEREYGLLRGVPFCAPLPITTVETLAHDLVPVRVPAGEAVVTEGEAGRRFYLIAEGRVRVTVGGVERRVEGPGECFGEIALLRDVPRTATVTALGDALLYALERDLFLTGVTGHSRAGRSAEAHAEAHLAADTVGTPG